MTPDPRAQSTSWLFGRVASLASAQRAESENVRSVRRMPYRIVRLRDGADIAGFTESFDVKQKMRRFLLALGDPEQKRFVIHRST